MPWFHYKKIYKNKIGNSDNKWDTGVSISSILLIILINNDLIVNTLEGNELIDDET